MMNRAVIYARVSSTGERQSTERQVADLKRYAAASGMEVVAVYEEKASGAKRYREQLAECLAFLKGGGAEHLLVTELSRLGRSLRQVLEVVDELTERGVNIYFQDHGMNTLTTKGTTNQVTKLLISMLGSFAEVERAQIASRLKEAGAGEGDFQTWPSGGNRYDEGRAAGQVPEGRQASAGREDHPGGGGRVRAVNEDRTEN